MSLPYISFAEGEELLQWLPLTEALARGHDLPKGEIRDTFLHRGADTLLSRAAWIDGLGLAVKTTTVFPGNTARDKPMINGSVSLFSDTDGTMDALIDFFLITKWKTAGDSLLAALRLARRDSRSILILGAGTVGTSLCEAFAAGFPDAKISIWNRTPDKVSDLLDTHPFVEHATDLENAVRSADIIISATMSSEPLVLGKWLQPGQHLNLIGAYRRDMRETDDRALQRSRIFVDSFDTTVEHIGEISIPLESGAIARDDLLADFYNLEEFTRQSPHEITVFINGGGAHLDLMTARHLLELWKAEQ